MDKLYRILYIFLQQTFRSTISDSDINELKYVIPLVYLNAKIEEY